MDILVFKEKGVKVLEGAVALLLKEGFDSSSVVKNVARLAETTEDFKNDFFNRSETVATMVKGESVNKNISKDLFVNEDLSKSICLLTDSEAKFVFSGLIESFEEFSYQNSKSAEIIQAGLMALSIGKVFKELEVAETFHIGGERKLNKMETANASKFFLETDIRRLLLNGGPFIHLSQISEKISLFDFEILKCAVHKSVCMNVSQFLSVTFLIEQSSQDPEDFMVSLNYVLNENKGPDDYFKQQLEETDFNIDDDEF